MFKIVILILNVQNVVNVYLKIVMVLKMKNVKDTNQYIHILNVKNVANVLQKIVMEQKN